MISLFRNGFILLFSFIVSHGYLLIKSLSRISPFAKRYREPVRGVPPRESLWFESIIWGTSVWTTRLPWLNTCVIRSLTAVTLLRFFGIEAVLRVGARKGDTPDILEAHFWVEDSSGEALIDGVSDLESYKELTVSE